MPHQPPAGGLVNHYTNIAHALSSDKALNEKANGTPSPPPGTPVVATIDPRPRAWQITASMPELQPAGWQLRAAAAEPSPMATTYLPRKPPEDEWQSERDAAADSPTLPC